MGKVNNHVRKEPALANPTPVCLPWCLPTLLVIAKLLVL